MTQWPDTNASIHLGQLVIEVFHAVMRYIYSTTSNGSFLYQDIINEKKSYLLSSGGSRTLKLGGLKWGWGSPFHGRLATTQGRRPSWGVGFFLKVFFRHKLVVVHFEDSKLGREENFKLVQELCALLWRPGVSAGGETPLPQRACHVVEGGDPLRHPSRASNPAVLVSYN